MSGGAKRKLSLSCSLIGGTKILILDEPSSGLDPYSRVKLFKVLKRAIDI